MVSDHTTLTGVDRRVNSAKQLNVNTLTNFLGEQRQRALGIDSKAERTRPLASLVWRIGGLDPRSASGTPAHEI